MESPGSRGASPGSATSFLQTDARTWESFSSALVLFLFICALIALVGGLGLASEKLLMLGCVNVIAGIGIGLFSGGSGILSLGHIAFFGVGAYASSWFSLSSALKPILLPNLPEFILQAEWPLLAALGPGVLAAMLVGALTGAALVRLRDTSAVIASFGFLVIAYLVFVGAKDLTNGNQSLYGLPMGDLTWPLLLGALAVAMLTAFAFKSSATGRNLEALRDNEMAARSIGINPELVLFSGWVLSAGIMGLAGALFSHAVGVVSPSAFYLDKTFALIVLIILGGYRSLSGCVVGAVLITIAEEVFKKTEEALGTFAGTELFAGLVMPKVFGLTALSFSALILIVLYLRPEGVVGYREIAALPWFRKLFGGVLPGQKHEVSPETHPPEYRVAESACLQAEHLEKQYGVFSAMSNVNLEVRAREIVGLIGPNGAGKTTFINVITGSLFASGGTITLNGKDATLWSASHLAKAGLGRTFQNIRLFGSLTALENVIAAVTSRQASLRRYDAEEQALAWLDRLGLSGRAQELASNLAYGDQRRLEIARALALQPNFLLLDEPAAGMNQSETLALKKLLRQLVTQFGVGILLVEHDLAMVMELCDRIVVLNKGEQIASGSPTSIRNHPAVIEAYIGEELD